VEDVRVEEAQRIAEELMEVPVEDPGVQLRVPEIAEPPADPDGLRPGREDRREQEDERGEAGLAARRRDARAVLLGPPFPGDRTARQRRL
jgi:hypothetical protein